MNDRRFCCPSKEVKTREDTEPYELPSVMSMDSQYYLLAYEWLCGEDLLGYGCIKLLDTICRGLSFSVWCLFYRVFHQCLWLEQAEKLVMDRAPEFACGDLQVFLELGE